MSDKLRILFVSQSAVMNNGAEYCLLTLIKGLDKKKFTPIVVLPFEGRMKGELDELGIKNYVVPLRPWISSYITGHDEVLSRRTEKVAEIIRKESIDIVHSNTSIIVEGAVAAMITGKPHVWHLHEILDGHPWLQLLFPLDFAYEFINLMSDDVVVVSKALRDNVGERVASERVRLIYNGLDKLEGKKEAGSLRKELGIGADELLVCTIGPIRSEKGYHTFVDSAEILKGEKIKFISVGSIDDPELYSELQVKIKEKKLHNSVKFLGYRKNAREILSEIDVYAVSSVTESFGLAPLEAMSVGKPVIATRCGGPEEVVVNGETGLLIPKNDPQALAEAIISLKDDEYRRKLGTAGEERFHNFFSADKYCAEFSRLYCSLREKRNLKFAEKKRTENYIKLLDNMEKALNCQARLFFNSYSWKVTSPLRWCFEKLKNAYRP